MSSAVGNQPATVTSFRKTGTDSINIRGTRISSQNSQLLTSTGSSTLDFFINGGLAVGTIGLIEEDRYSTYSDILLKYFLAEGIANNHKIFLSSGGKDSQKILTELPSMKVPDVKTEDKDSNFSLDENLKIAWRYQKQSSSFASAVKADSFNHGYDFSKPIPPDILKQCSVTTCDPSRLSEEQTDDTLTFVNFPYSSLLQRISSEINSNGYRTSAKRSENIMRIAVSSLGSPLWRCSSESNQELHLVRFLYLLKALLRTSFAVALITVPSYLIEDIVLRNRMRQMCDTVISLESFVGSDKKSNPLYKEFDGLLQIVKLPILNTFVYPTLVSDLAFKLKRRDFVIERLHLPPDFEDSSDGPGAYGCSGQPSKLDF